MTTINTDNGSKEVLAFAQAKSGPRKSIVSEATLSPDDEFISYVYQGNVYLVKRERGGTSLALVDELGNASGDRVSRDGGAHGLHWHAWGDAITWVHGRSEEHTSELTA